MGPLPHDPGRYSVNIDVAPKALAGFGQTREFDQPYGGPPTTCVTSGDVAVEATAVGVVGVAIPRRHKHRTGDNQCGERPIGWSCVLPLDRVSGNVIECRSGKAPMPPTWRMVRSNRWLVRTHGSVLTSSHGVPPCGPNNWVEHMTRLTGTMWLTNLPSKSVISTCSDPRSTHCFSAN